MLAPQCRLPSSSLWYTISLGKETPYYGVHVWNDSKRGTLLKFIHVVLRCFQIFSLDTSRYDGQCCNDRCLHCEHYRLYNHCSKLLAGKTPAKDLRRFYTRRSRPCQGIMLVNMKALFIGISFFVHREQHPLDALW